MKGNEAIYAKLALADAVLVAVAESGLLRKKRRAVKQARKRASTRKTKANGADRTSRKAAASEPRMPA